MTASLTLVLSLLLAQQPPRGTRQETTPPAPAAEQAKPEAPKPLVEEPPVNTKHELRINGKTLNYTATAGMMPIKSQQGEIEANLFYVGYTLDGTTDPSKRPLMIAFNGGPGAASVWLHLGCIGPKRVKMGEDGSMPAAPYQLVDNDQTWLDQADLVFVDPVGTGYSRAARPDLQRRFNGFEGDVQSVGEFIRLYLTRNERWASPLFLVGESYGTTRAAALSGHLIEEGIAFNGVALLSSVLNFESVRFGPGNDLPYELFLPTYTATAWYHKKLAPDLETDLKKTLQEVEHWALTGYAEALAKGDRLTAAEHKALIDKLARYTGLDPRYVDNANGRLEIQRFTREILRDRKLLAGRLDSRLTGPAPLSTSETVEFDPSMTAIRPPYTAMINQYVRADLNYKTDAVYYTLGGGILPWDYGVQNQNRYVDVADSLRSAFAKNPYMKVFLGCGYFDLATPYFAAEYVFNHMGLHPTLRKNITTKYYTAGHMFYIDVPSLKKLRTDIGQFMENSIPAHVQ